MGKAAALVGSPTFCGPVRRFFLLSPFGKTGFQPHLCLFHWWIWPAAFGTLCEWENARRAGEVVEWTGSNGFECESRAGCHRYCPRYAHSNRCVRSNWMVLWFPTQRKVGLVIDFHPIYRAWFLDRPQGSANHAKGARRANNAYPHRLISILSLHSPDGGAWVAFRDDWRGTGFDHPVARDYFRSTDTSSWTANMVVRGLDGCFVVLAHTAARCAVLTHVAYLDSHAIILMTD
jgi:hypothetical protein